MRCHYHTDEYGQKHLIPGCWGVTLHWHLPDKEALDFCTCYKPARMSKEEIIKSLEQDNKLLKQRIEELEEQLKQHIK